MVDKLPLSIKCFSMVGVKHSLCQLSPAPGRLCGLSIKGRENSDFKPPMPCAHTPPWESAR
ncbi:hypothetical protein DPMN_113704 [Dreissena polymorpha]|uniref:Uncharacterized protein n=1 Tax=Dreissena polymorpha TaxID=45954 RepID=A0A9D4QRS6_DREPO|nr:hypothetical protein DPMN_113704 [Dreissena polymorpha]